MEDNKRIIIVLGSIMIVLFILVLICIGILIKLQDTNIDTGLISEENAPIISSDVKENTNWKGVTVRNDYYTVKSIVEQYYSALCNLNNSSEDILVFEEYENIVHSEEISKEKENTKERIYKFFDENYVKDTGLTVSNVQEKLGTYKELYVLIEDMYVKDVTITLKLYRVCGTIIEKDTGEKEKFELIIAIDTNNSRFNLYTSEYVQENIDDIEVKLTTNKIDDRVYNRYTYKVVNDEAYAKYLLESYTKSIRYNNIDYSYSRLNEEYRINKFNEISDYEKYIQENKQSIISATLKYYKYNIQEDYIQYICVDQNDNYYIFNEKATMSYDLILDIYTVDLPEYIERYETADKVQKVGLNINKVMTSINEKDYRYVYSKLNTTYKDSYFKDYNLFTKYLESICYKSNVISIKKCEDIGEDTYTCTIQLTNKTNPEEFKDIIIIVKLNNDRNFEISFGREV